MKVWSLHGMGLREWRGRRGPCVSGVSGAECFALDKSIFKKKCRSRATMVLTFTLVGGSNTRFHQSTSQGQEHTYR